ncbi:MAG: DUF3276 family protein [Lewinellaceae bacterium]|nr:DUF3276 family protein [Lewinellaceae bacterium]
MEKTVLFSETLKGSGRTYFFDLKQASNGKPFLSIAGSNKNQEGEYERVRLLIFSDDFEKFAEVLGKAISHQADTQETA